MHPSNQRWHPRLTPYRLLVLSTTVGLGTAKVVATQRGSTLLPITLEWIAGVVVSIILYVGSFYDSYWEAQDAPRPFLWMFSVDCMDTVWLLASRLSIPRPQYSSLERRSTGSSFSPRFPPITLYRILVCATVVVFGLTKGILGYYASRSAPAWIEWASGVVVGTAIYCLGLYEYSVPNVWPAIFVKDYQDILLPRLRWASLILLSVMSTTAFAYYWLIHGPEVNDASLKSRTLFSLTLWIYDVFSYWLAFLTLTFFGIWFTFLAMRPLLPRRLPSRIWSNPFNYTLITDRRIGMLCFIPPAVLFSGLFLASVYGALIEPHNGKPISVKAMGIFLFALHAGVCLVGVRIVSSLKT